MTFPNIGGTSGSVPAAPVVQAGVESSPKAASRANAAGGAALPSQHQDPAPAQASSQQLDSALENLRKAVASSGRDLNFSVDKQSGKTIVRVVDQSTGQLIRQIPSEEFLAISQSIGQMQGLLLKKQA